MKVYNIGLIGRGKMGKAFQGEIEKSNKFNLVKIFSKRDIQNKKQNIKKFFKSNVLDLIIITSPVESHYKYLNYAIKYKKNIIFQNLHENLNQKVDSISERVPEYDFEGPGPQKNPKNKKKFKILLKICV